MLTDLDLAISGFVSLVVLPLAVISLLTGSKPPENTIFYKYYRAERHLMAIGNLFLLTVCATAVAKFAQHLGFIGAETAETFTTWMSGPLMVLLAVFLVFLLRAVLKVRRAERTE